MNYEKKYKEALERARALRNEAIEKEYAVDYIKDYETIFPELCESEEETTRKELLDFVRSFWADHKEKLPQASRWVTYLEKLKENPKSTDSIPSDCVSDAKCENRWHKVKDFLPNSAREVFCKDAIGNFFIGVYYKSAQSWEVVMYDDCDKSNEDNPPVVEWCEIPSNEQKEQKPAEWSEEDKEHLDSIIESYKELLKDYSSNHDVDYIPYNTPVVTRTALNDIKFLKSLRPQYHGDVTMTEAYKMGFEAGKASSWKPSEEQMSMLLAVINDPNNASAESCNIALISLYNELKKLM